MKKILLCSAFALGLSMALDVYADTATGHVVSTDGSSVTVQQENGNQVTMQTTPETTYRMKKVAKRNKMKDGKSLKKGETYFQPMIEEDDFIEVIYSPTTGNILIIEDVVIHDD